MEKGRVGKSEKGQLVRVRMRRQLVRARRGRELELEDKGWMG